MLIYFDTDTLYAVGVKINKCLNFFVFASWFKMLAVNTVSDFVLFVFYTKLEGLYKTGGLHQSGGIHQTGGFTQNWRFK